MPVYKRVSCTHCTKYVELRNDEDKWKKMVCTRCGNGYNITDKNSDYYVDYVFDNRRFREKIGKSKALAETVLAKIKVEIVECRYLKVKKNTNINFSTFADEYYECHSKVNNRSWRTFDRHNIKRLKQYFGDKNLSEITSYMIDKFKAERAKEVSPATVNRQLACLKSIFNKATAWGKFEGANPVKVIKLFKENNQRLRFLEQTEILKLLDCCAEHLKPIVIIALNTGFRRGEILSLKWSSVDFERSIIYLKNTKNGEGREVPMNVAVKNALIRQPRHSHSNYIFYKKDGTPIGDIKKSFLTALKKSGINNFHFHDLRHTFASQLAMNSVDLNTIRELLGHKSMVMTIRYSHLSQQHKQQAVDILDRCNDTGMTQKLIEADEGEVSNSVSHSMTVV